MRDHALPDHRCLNLAQLEREGGCDVRLLTRGLADEELARLAVMIGEALGAQTALGTLLGLGERA